MKTIGIGLVYIGFALFSPFSLLFVHGGGFKWKELLRTPFLWLIAPIVIPLAIVGYPLLMLGSFLGDF